MNRMPTPEGDEGGGAQARVNVLAELPLLEARLDAPSLKTPDVDQSQVITKGWIRKRELAKLALCF